MRYRFFRSAAPGISLLEVMMVVGILALVGSMAIGALGAFRNRSQLDSAVRQTLSTIRLAQTNTLAAKNNTAAGVHFDADRITLFSGSLYNPAAPDNEVTLMPNGVLLAPSLQSGASDVIFQRLSGRTEAYGTVAFSYGSDSRVITIEASGGARAESGSFPEQGTRNADTRHVTFSLGWTIQNATALKLVFTDPPNPTVTNTIAMANYFNTDRTNFDWNGITAVNGSNQLIRAHTQFLSATSTVFSVHRDRIQNSKAVTVSIIDGGLEKPIVSYTAAGTTTAESYAGVMQIQ